MGEKIAKRDYLPNSCHLWGGETVVHVFGAGGDGGRNQDVVLGSLPYIKDNMVVVAAASDGWDNGEMAGAIGDSQLFDLSLEKGVSVQKFLDNNSSAIFFRQVGGHIRTGRTGANVADFYMVLKGEQLLGQEDESWDEGESVDLNTDEDE